MAELPMGTTGWATSGGVFFDHRAYENGDTALYYEFDTLDYCYGHSNGLYQYHYHAVRFMSVKE